MMDDVRVMVELDRMTEDRITALEQEVECLKRVLLTHQTVIAEMGNTIILQRKNIELFWSR